MNATCFDMIRKIANRFDESCRTEAASTDFQEYISHWKRGKRDPLLDDRVSRVLFIILRSENSSCLRLTRKEDHSLGIALVMWCCDDDHDSSSASLFFLSRSFRLLLLWLLLLLRKKRKKRKKWNQDLFLFVFPAERTSTIPLSS